MEHDPNTFITELAYWDGHQHREDEIVYSSKHRENVEWAATMAHLSGRFASIGKTTRAWRVHIGKATKSVVRSDQYYDTFTTEPVYSTVTSSGFYLMRRNGKITLTGNTGRSSSSKSPRGLGGNTQNKAERIRPMFVADPGFELAYADLMQAESLDLAYEGECEAYIRAHDEDLHTYVTRIIFPGLPWVWDIKRDKEIAKMAPPWDSAPGHNYRWYTKRNSHGYGYGVTPEGTARIVHGKVADAREAHAKIDEAFPCIKGTYHARLRERVRQGLPIVTPLGREIPLMGRPWDNATFRQAYSASPQATVSDLVWIAAYRIYREHDPHLIQILGNGYDALLMQWRPEDRDKALEAVVKAMQIPVAMPGGRTMTIGVEVSVGKNWGKYDPHTNPDGQKEIFP